MSGGSSLPVQTVSDQRNPSEQAKSHAGIFHRSLADRQSPDWEGRATANRWRSRKETKGATLQLIETAQMLDDRNSRRQQQRMSGPCGILHIVNVGAINSHQGRTSLNQVIARLPRQEGTGAEVVRRAPTPRPSGANEHCLVPNRDR